VAGDGCEVWYSPNGNAGSWTQINSDGFGDPQNAVCGALGEFQGALCVGTVNHQAAQLWRYDGSSWTNVSPDFRGDFGGVNPRVQSMTPAYQFTVLASRLFIGGGNPFPPIGADLWSTGNISGPAPRWEFAAPRGFGNPHNRFIEVLLYRFPYVFASTYNQEDGAEVWMGDALPEWLEGKEPYQWQPVSVGRVATTVLGLLEQVPQVMTYAAAITLRPIRILVLSRIWRRFDRTNDYRQPELTKSDDSVGRPPQ
jgi:hypothetical protein